MKIAVKCINCDWIGNAEVGRRKGGCPLSQQQCPRCGSDIKRRSGMRKDTEEMADIKEIKEGYFGEELDDDVYASREVREAADKEIASKKRGRG